MQKHLNVRCPYCDSVQNYEVKQGAQLLYCEPEEGGCDNYFVIELDFKPEYKTYRLEGKAING